MFFLQNIKQFLNVLLLQWSCPNRTDYRLLVDPEKSETS